jgi:Skp1 family, tetramerisation domain
MSPSVSVRYYLRLYLENVSLTRFADRDVIERSVLLKNMIDDIGEAATSEAIPINNVTFTSLVSDLTKLTTIRSTSLS